MKTRVYLFAVTIFVCVVSSVVISNALLLSTPTEKSMEYSRINLGGAQSSVGRFQLDDSITLTIASGKQSGTKYAIDSIKVEANNGIATAIGCDKVLITWSQYSLDGAVGYQIHRATSPDGEYEDVASVGLSTTQYLDESVSSGTTYYYIIVIVDSESNETSVTEPMVVTTQSQEDIPHAVEDGWKEYK